MREGGSYTLASEGVQEWAGTNQSVYGVYGQFQRLGYKTVNRIVISILEQLIVKIQRPLYLSRDWGTRTFFVWDVEPSRDKIKF